MNVLRIQKAKAAEADNHRKTGTPAPEKDESQVALEKILYIGREFNSYDEVNDLVNTLKTEYFFPLRIENCNTVKAYNQALKNKIDESMKYRRVVFVCIHYGVHRARCEKLLRVNQNVFAKNCPFTFTVTYIAQFKKLVITELNAKHANHVMSAEHIKLYHRTKRLSVEAQSFIKASLEANVAPSTIRKTVLSNFDVHLKTKDIYNLKHKFTTVEPGKDWKISCGILEEISQDPLNFAHIFHSEDSSVHGIYLQLKEQRAHFSKFGDVCFIDGSYAISKGEMTLYAIIVVDNNGNSQPAAFFLVKNESFDAVKSCLELFTKNNDLSKTRTVIINKHGDEIAFFSSIFTNARVVICQSYASKIVEALLGKTALDLAQKRKLLQKFKKAMNTSNMEEFEKYQGKLTTHEQVGGLFLDWFGKAELWATAFRKTLFTLQTNTTNRMDKFHKLVKEVLPIGSSVSCVIKGVLNITKGNAQESGMQNMERDIKSPQTKNSDFNSFLGELTPFAAGLVFTHFKKSGTGLRITQEDDEWFELTTNEQGGATYRVSSEMKTCTCLFFNTHELPCQHIMHVRKTRKVAMGETICNKRWKQQQDDPEYMLTESEHIEEEELTKEVKHAKAMELLTSVADLLSEMSKDPFEKNMASLLNLKLFMEEHQTIEFIECGNVTNVLEEETLPPPHFMISEMSGSVEMPDISGVNDNEISCSSEKANISLAKEISFSSDKTDDSVVSPCISEIKK